MTTKHTRTPGPWKLCSTYQEAQRGRAHIATWADQELPLATIKPLHIDPMESLANAEFIVRACNAHDDLLAACEAMRDLLSNSNVRFMICDGGRGHLGEQSLYHRTINEARAAIARATGEKGEQTK